MKMKFNNRRSPFQSNSDRAAAVVRQIFIMDTAPKWKIRTE